MLNWLSRWGRRLWRSCCYPFQFWRSCNSEVQAAPASFEDSSNRAFPRSRLEAIRQGILVPPKAESPLDDLALEETVAEAELDLEEALFLSGEGAVDRIADAPFFAPGAVGATGENPLDSPALSQSTASKLRRSLKPKVKSATVEPPFDWVLENRLAIGALPKKAWLPALEEQGIHTVISLCDEAEGKLPQGIAQQFRCVRVPLPDSRYARCLTVEELADAVDLIHWHLQKQQTVYIHCLAGIERSPLVAIAYLARYRSMDLLDAVSWLSHVHSRSRPISAQLQVVREYIAMA